KQRVLLAQALAQEPKVLILDEPTNHLDLAYQKELLDLLNDTIEADDLTVVAIFHDLNIASLYCNQVMLLNDEKVAICDKYEVVLQHERINTIYHKKVETFAHTQLAKQQEMLIPESNKKIEKNINKNKYIIKVK